MMRFMWDEKYSVNIRSIDRQHQRFFEIINELYFSFGRGEGNQELLGEIVNKLAEYGNFHLGYEEKYFREFDYPETEEHIGQHDVFRQKIVGYQEKLKEPITDLAGTANEIADFAKDWLAGHILAMDQKYSQFFLTNGVE